MAMTILSIGMLAVVAAFNSGIVSLARASQVSTGAALADQQMEQYRALPNSCIYLTSVSNNSAYVADSAYTASQVTSSAACTALGITPPTNATTASRSVAAASSPDQKSYQVDTYIVYACPGQTPATPPCTGSSRQVTQVTVVVRDGRITSKRYARQVSTFDVSTG